MEKAKICLRCRCENQLSATRCNGCGATSFEDFPRDVRDTLLKKSRNRVIACWIGIALVGMIFFGIGEAPWYGRLLMFLFFQIMIAGWFGLMLYVQTKASAQTPEGEAFRGPMPVWRAVFWTCFAAAGVFSCIYWLELDHSWLKAILGALFCSSGIGGFAFMLNWVRGEHGKAWAHKYMRQILTVYSFALSAMALLKLIMFYLSHKR